MKKKVLSCCLAAMLAMSLLSGCGAEKKPEAATSAEKETTAQKPAEQAQEELPGLFISKEPKELTLHLHIYNKFVFNDSWVSFQKAAELR